ncbi:hypothetical protein GCM10009798_11230 [Nocardioides panacihumi]|uniref:DUF4241 domain-containing protein n=1 Tax=Nocardioides panacihumi TaxID=400774 RepID=A0ABP5BXM8_9ACTN
MSCPPEFLVRFGDRYLFPENVRYPEQTVTLTAMPGPALPMRWGLLAIADPWYPETTPKFAATTIGGGGAKVTSLTTVARTRTGDGDADVMAVAASAGDLDRVATWEPLLQDEKHFHLDSDSALGAFYEISDAALLQPLFEDADHMKTVYDRALTEKVVAMEVDGRVVAVVFLCPDGSGIYPVHVGFDADMSAVAVTVDLRLLEAADRLD